MLFIFRFVWCLPNSSRKITITKVRIFFLSKWIHYYFAQWVGYKHELLQSVCKGEGCLATSWPNHKGLVYINNYNLLQGSHLLNLTAHRGSCLHLRHIIDSFQTLLSSVSAMNTDVNTTNTNVQDFLFRSSSARLTFQQMSEDFVCLCSIGRHWSRIYHSKDSTILCNTHSRTLRTERGVLWGF